MENNQSGVDVFLYNHFPNDVRPRKEAKSLVDEGIQLRVYCLRDYDEDPYSLLWGSVEVHRVLTAGPITRVSPIRMLFFWIAVIKSWTMRDRLAAIHCHDLSALPPGVIISLLHRLFLVYDSHELFPETARDRYGFLHYLILFSLESVCLPLVDLLIGVSESQLEVLQGRFSGPTLALNNYPSVSEIEYLYHPVDEPLIIGMSGYILKVRGHHEVMDALALMARDYPIEFRVAGDGPERQAVEDKARSMPYPCTFLGYIESKEDLWKEVAKFDYAIIANHPTRNYLVTSTNRAYEYAALGLPFICPHYGGISDIPAALELPNFNPLIPSSIKEALERLIEMPREEISRKGRALVEQKFCWEENRKKLLEIYRRLIPFETNDIECK